NRAITNSHGRRLRGILIVVEVALAIVLMIGAGLLMRSFNNYQKLKAGFKPENIFTARIALSQTKYTEKSQFINFYRQLLEKAQQLPGVESAAMILMRPLSGTVGWDAK